VLATLTIAVVTVMIVGVGLWMTRAGKLAEADA
jgi:hypothetical protein